MDVADFVQAAGSAVLDMVEREWEPLSQDELEQRLDQAVEEILEAELVARVRAQPPAVHMQWLQTAPPPDPPEEEPGAREPPPPPPPPPLGGLIEEAPVDPIDGDAVKYITDLVRNSKSHYSKAGLAGRARLSLPHTVLLSLTLLSRRVSYRSVSDRFRLDKGNIHRIFFAFCERVNTLEEELIRWPLDREAVDLAVPLSTLLGTAGGLEELGPPQVLGVLGHSRVPIRLPTGKQNVESAAPEVKRMRREAHPDSWLNLELVCDRHGRFLHCRICKGSDTDRAGGLRDKLRDRPELMPPGACLVARTGYPLTAHILTPHVSCLGPGESLYNKTLTAHFSILDQAIAALKSRFQRLRYLDMGSYERARAVVLTACILHNVFLDIGQEVPGEAEQEEEMVLEEEGEADEEGIRRRGAVTDLLYKELESGCLT